MVIDSHRHFWHYTDAEFGWIADDCLRRDFLPMDCGGMDSCVAVEARQCVEETEWLLDLAARHDFIKGVVGWLPITAPNFPEILEGFVSHADLRVFASPREEDSLREKHNVLRAKLLPQIYSLGFLNPDVDYYV